jgi:hypothetical protein
MAYDDFNDGEWITVFGASSNRWCLKHPVIYSLFELSEALAVTALWIWAFYEDVLAPSANCGGKFFIFLTYWSLTAQVFYVWVAWFVTRQANAMAEGRKAKQMKMPWYAYATWVLQDILLPTTFMVFVLYFALVVDWNSPPGFGKSYFTHGANFALMCSDVFMSQQPYYLLHGLYFGGFALVYLAFTYIYFAADGTSCSGHPYIYAALDWNNLQSTRALATLLLTVACPLVNVAFWLMVSKCFPGRRGGVKDAAIVGGSADKASAQDASKKDAPAAQDASAQEV